MKRILALLIVMLMAFSSVFALSVSAAENSTAEDTTESDIEQQIKEALTADGGLSSGLTPDRITVYGMITLSDGSVLFNFKDDYGWIDVIADFQIGPYEYFVDFGSQKFMYINSKVYRIVDAYDEGLISDSLLDEIAKALGLVNTQQIKEALIRTKLPDATPEEISISYDRLHTLSDGSVVFRYRYLSDSYSDIFYDVEIGNYRYRENDGYEYNIFINQDVYILKDAYDEGIISDSLLDEIADVLDFEEIEPITESETEPTTDNTSGDSGTQPTTDNTSGNNSSATQPTVIDASEGDKTEPLPTIIDRSEGNKPEVSTKDESTPDSANGDNTAVATGQNSLTATAVVVLLLMIFAACSLRIRSKFE